MKQFSILGILLLAAVCSFSQKVEMKQKLRVGINQSGNYPLRFIDPAKDTLVKAESKVYDATGKLLSYQLTKSNDWSKGKVVDSKVTTLPGVLKDISVIYADIKPDEGRLLVYPWPYNETVTFKAENQFYKDHLFYIDLEDRVNLSFWSTSFHAGALTMPIKAYLGGKDSVSGTVEAGVNAGLYFGFKFGKKKFLKLPNEKEYTESNWAFSTNMILGLNKLEITDANVTDKTSKFRGNTMSLSTGLAAGFHLNKFTVFLAAGIDIPLSSKAKYWGYKGVPWLGFGAGYEIF